MKRRWVGLIVWKNLRISWHQIPKIKRRKMWLYDSMDERKRNKCPPWILSPADSDIDVMWYDFLARNFTISTFYLTTCPTYFLSFHLKYSFSPPYSISTHYFTNNSLFLCINWNADRRAHFFHCFFLFWNIQSNRNCNKPLNCWAALQMITQESNRRGWRIQYTYYRLKIHIKWDWIFLVRRMHAWVTSAVVSVLNP